MTRYVLAGHFGPGDTAPMDAGENVVVTPFDLATGQRRLGRGIGTALKLLRNYGVRPSEVGVDLIVIAAHVHAADTRLNRIATSQDAWTREIGLIIPVSSPDLWGAATLVLERMLRFLTGDHWGFTFRHRPSGFENLSPVALPGVEMPKFDGISLFSGGLDSLIGAIDTIIEGQWPLFVSHSGEGAVSKPQRDLFEMLAAAMALRRESNRRPDRLRFAMTFPRNLIPGAGSEDSTRGRSFLFLAIGALAGSGLKGAFDLRIPENGLILLSRKIELFSNRRRLVNNEDSCPS